MTTLNKPIPPLKSGVEAVQVEHEGKPMVVLHDQEGINRDSIAVTLPGFLLVTMLDGQKTSSDIQAAFTKATGQMLRAQEIDALVAELDKAGMLETETLREKRRRTMKDFLDNPLRPAMHVKGGYPEDKLELATFLGKFFKDPKGPGKQTATEATRPSPLALFAPHIDFHRGGPLYAWAYQALSECERPDVVIGLGVAHMSPNSPWVLTPKAYETPYGPMKVSDEHYKDFATSLWYDVAADQWAHRTEHSLEFQALWLRYLWRDKTPPWVPVLCSSFERFCPDRAPSSVTSIEEGILKVGEQLKRRQAAGEKIMILAGVDLSHVGPRFGDDEKLGPELEKKVEAADRASLDLAWDGDADKFYLSVVEGGHWRKWCGLSAIYTALRLAKILSPKPIKGDMLAYGQAPDPMGGIVSFTSAVFRRP